jgi:hypothetical protein
MEKEEQIKLVNDWMKNVSIALGVELALDEQGICFFQIGEEIVIGIEVSPDLPLIHLYSPLMQLSFEDKKNEEALLLLSRILELNAFQTLTRGGAIAVTPQGGPLIFCYSVPIEGTDSEKFNQILGGFYETIPEIKKLVIQATSDLVEKKPQQSSFLLNKQGFIKI